MSGKGIKYMVGEDINQPKKRKGGGGNSARRDMNCADASCLTKLCQPVRH